MTEELALNDCSGLRVLPENIWIVLIVDQNRIYCLKNRIQFDNDVSICRAFFSSLYSESSYDDFKEGNEQLANKSLRIFQKGKVFFIVIQDPSYPVDQLDLENSNMLCAVPSEILSYFFSPHPPLEEAKVLLDRANAADSVATVQELYDIFRDIKAAHRGNHVLREIDLQFRVVAENLERTEECEAGEKIRRFRVDNWFVVGSRESLPSRSCEGYAQFLQQLFGTKTITANDIQILKPSWELSWCSGGKYQPTIEALAAKHVLIRARDDLTFTFDDIEKSCKKKAKARCLIRGGFEEFYYEFYPFREKRATFVQDVFLFLLGRKPPLEFLTDELLAKGIRCYRKATKLFFVLDTMFWGLSSTWQSFLSHDFVSELASHPAISSTALVIFHKAKDILGDFQSVHSKLATFFMLDAVTSTTQRGSLTSENLVNMWRNFNEGRNKTIFKVAQSKFPETRSYQALYFSLQLLLQLQFSPEYETYFGSNMCPYTDYAQNFIWMLAETGKCLCMCYTMYVLAAAEEVGLQDYILPVPALWHIAIRIVTPDTTLKPKIFGSWREGTELAILDAGFHENQMHFNVHTKMPDFAAVFLDTGSTRRIKVTPAPIFDTLDYDFTVRTTWVFIHDFIHFITLKRTRKRAEKLLEIAAVAHLYDVPEVFFLFASNEKDEGQIKAHLRRVAERLQQPLNELLLENISSQFEVFQERTSP
jgi:hypothetical protein